MHELRQVLRAAVTLAVDQHGNLAVKQRWLGCGVYDAAVCEQHRAVLHDLRAFGVTVFLGETSALHERARAGQHFKIHAAGIIAHVHNQPRQPHALCSSDQLVDARSDLADHIKTGNANVADAARRERFEARQPRGQHRAAHRHFQQHRTALNTQPDARAAADRSGNAGLKIAAELGAGLPIDADQTIAAPQTRCGCGTVLPDIGDQALAAEGDFSSCNPQARTGGPQSGALALHFVALRREQQIRMSVRDRLEHLLHHADRCAVRTSLQLFRAGRVQLRAELRGQRLERHG